MDDIWHVPHFEKMLYDQGQLAGAYVDAFSITGEQRFAHVARDILDYIRRDLTHPEGGIFSAEDADSLEEAEWGGGGKGKGHKKDGAFYVWTKEEVSHHDRWRSGIPPGGIVTNRFQKAV